MITSTGAVFEGPTEAEELLFQQTYNTLVQQQITKLLARKEHHDRRILAGTADVEDHAAAFMLVDLVCKLREMFI